MAVLEQFADVGSEGHVSSPGAAPRMGWREKGKKGYLQLTDCTNRGRNTTRSSESGNSQPPVGRCARGASC